MTGFADRWRAAAPPSLAEIEALAQEAYARLPDEFRAMCQDLIIRVEDFPTAVSWYERALPTLSADESLVVKLADARARNGDLDVARASLDKLLEKNPGNAAARNLRRRIQ